MQTKIKKHRFKVYIRECKRCGEFTEVPTKLTKFCLGCKVILNKERIEKSLIVRRKNKKNELNNNDRCMGELKTFA
jgi:hypothetical protein